MIILLIEGLTTRKHCLIKPRQLLRIERELCAKPGPVLMRGLFPLTRSPGLFSAGWQLAVRVLITFH